jgi:hypothetical protein
MLSEALQEKRERFVNRYEALFGNWPGAKSEEIAMEWFKLIDNVPLDQLPKLFSGVLKEHGKRMGAPRCGLFWIVWKQIRPPKPQEERPVNDHCGLCNNSGRMTARARWEKDGRGYDVPRFPDRPDFPGPLANIATYCACPRGDRYRNLTTEGLHTVILRWRRDVLPNLARELDVGSLGSPEIWAAYELSRRANRAADAKQPVEAPETAAVASEVLRDASVAEELQAPSNGGNGAGMEPVPEPATGPLQANEETPF